MFHFSKKTDYAIVAMSHIGNRFKPTTAKEIANTYHYSEQLTANVLKELASSGLLKGIRGNQGGYLLNKFPKDISLSLILEITDGPFFLTACGFEKGVCAAESFCPSKTPMNLLQERIKKLFDEISLEDFINNNIATQSFKELR